MNTKKNILFIERGTLNIPDELSYYIFNQIEPIHTAFNVNVFYFKMIRSN